MLLCMAICGILVAERTSRDFVKSLFYLEIT